MKHLNISIPLHTFHRLMINHLRECLNKHGGQVRICISDIKSHWIAFDSETRAAIVSEINWHLEEHHHLKNDEFLAADFKAWESLLEWIKDNRDSAPKTETPKPVVNLLPVVDPNKCRHKEK